MTELAIPSFRILYASQVNTQRIRYMSGIGNLLAAGLLSLLASIAMAALLYTRTLGKRLGKLVDQAAALAFDEKVVTWNPIDGEDEIELIQRVLSESTMELKRKEREQQEASKIIEGSLHEKEVLLKEIHHRVKNNFQIISSLLSLQTMSIEDEKIVHLLQESRDRIQSMALIHERLYRSENFSYIDFREYTESIAEQISSSYGTKYGSIRLEINADKVSLTLDSAIPLGLILNELLTNAYKHAFPNEKTGSIRISLRAIGQDEGELIVQDDGVGLRDDFKARRTGSLGMELIHTLVNQIRGLLTISSPPEGSRRGTLVRIQFKS